MRLLWEGTQPGPENSANWFSVCYRSNKKHIPYDQPQMNGCCMPPHIDHTTSIIHEVEVKIKCDSILWLKIKKKRFTSSFFCSAWSSESRSFSTCLLWDRILPSWRLRVLLMPPVALQRSSAEFLFKTSTDWEIFLSLKFVILDSYSTGIYSLG